ncbi:copper resistance CopC/CopD family protein [Streptomyces sp. 4N509B]|uniref:copper resistance CopC/CopD family protein n=1 Tax=Streptomyces sp. 4N509B TaxID=3457413 RepID=UPI003FD40F0A
MTAPTSPRPLPGVLPGAALGPAFGAALGTAPGVRRRRPVRSLLAAALATAATAFALLLVAAPPAAAHASLTGTSPESGEVVATAPDRVTLTFSEPVSVPDDGIRVLDPDGRPVHTGQPTDLADETDAARYGVSLRADVPDGTYVVAWQAVSADSHPISGAFTFAVGAPSDTSVDASDVADTGGGDDGAVGALYDVARYAAYTGFVLLAGAAAFALSCWPRAAAHRTTHRLLLLGWVTLTVATLAQLLLRTPYTGSGRLADAFDLDGLQDVIGTKTGTYLVSRLLLLAAATLFLAVLTGSYARLRGALGAGDAVPGRVRDLHFGLAVGGLILATGTAATWALSEHASTGPQTGLAIPADTLHLLAAAAWLGGLATLLSLLHRAPEALPRDAIRRFSRLALLSVVTLAVTGLYQSWRQVRTLDALTDTDYGRLLLVKVALVAAILAVASLSRRFTARLADAPAPAPASASASDGNDGNDGNDGAGDDAGDGADPRAEVTPENPERARQLARQRAAIERTRLRRAREADPTRAGLRRSVLAEAGIAAVVLAVTTILTTTTPARTEAATPAEPGGGDTPGSSQPARPTAEPEPFSGTIAYDTGGDNGQGTAHLDLAPARSGGDNTLTVHLTDPEGGTADAVELRVALTLPAEDIGPLRYDEPERVGEGRWTVTGLQLPRPGEWRLDLTVRTSDIDQTTVSTTIPIG